VEGPRFALLDWTAGGPITPGDEKGLLISKATADRLLVHCGDEVTVVFNTLAQQRNSLSLVVRGIFRDTSFFGYASYMDITTLDTALGTEPGAVTVLGAIIEPGWSSTEFGASLVNRLAARVSTYPLISSRQAQVDARNRGGDGQSVGVMTLDANLAQIDDILSSLLVVTWLACGLFLAILMIGVGNTYRMIIFERTQEIGTLRAMGISRPRLMGLLLSEASFLGSAGVVLGSLMGSFALCGLRLPNFSDNTLALLFLQEGRLVPWLPPAPFAGAALTLVLVTVLGAGVPALRAARLRPVDALRQGDSQ